MADIIKSKDNVPVKFVDQGDGTWALKVSASVTASDSSNIGTNGSAIPAKSAAVGGTDGTNLRAIAVDSSGRLVIMPSGSVSTTEASVSLSANTSATVAASNTSRLTITIDNPNATDIWINTQGAAVATAGSSMRIFGNTQVTFTVQEIGTNAITAISVPAVTIRYREISKT